MKKVYFPIAAIVQLIILMAPAFSQKADFPPNVLNSHEKYISYLRSAEERTYQEVLAHYETYLLAHPTDVAVHIERCRFIGSAFNQENADYNLKQEEFDQSLIELAEKFPDDPDVLIYRSEFLYGDSAIAFFKNVLENQERNPALWQGKALWKIHEGLANQLSYQDKNQESIESALKAMELNDTLDLSLLLAQAYQATNQPKEAVHILTKYVKSDQSAWELSRKGKLLLELDAPAHALTAFRLAKQKNGHNWVDDSSFAKALEKTGAYPEARIVLLLQANSPSAGQKEKIALFQHDLRYQPADTALASYTQVRDSGYRADPLGYYRLSLFAKHPLLVWQWRDCIGLGILLLVVAGLCLAPYLWILPVHFMGTRFSPSSMHSTQPWTLTHFWLISAGYLLISLGLTMVFNYPYILSFFADEYAQLVEETPETIWQAKELLVFSGLMMLITTLLVRKCNWSQLILSKWSVGKQIGFGIVTAIGLRMLTGVFFIVYQQLFGASPSLPLIADLPLASIEEYILALRNHYGLLLTFLVVAVLVPIYEEIIFRGIILHASQKYIFFFGANVFQALLFAFIHNNFSWFLFYFSFGLIAGYLRKQSAGLGTGIVFHATNNAMALLTILR